MEQNAQELTQLHQAIAHLANLLEAQAAYVEAQWLGRIICLQQTRQQNDAHHQGGWLWVAVTSEMVKNVTKPASQCQKARDKERDKTA
jgi:2-methylaconitate cis-trans-isomerase PrpF